MMIPRYPVCYGLRQYVPAILALVANRPPSPESLAQIVGQRPLYWTGTGRLALALALRGLGLPAGAKVAVPLFGSSTVLRSIQHAGLKPLFVECDETFTATPTAIARARSEASCAVVEHLFGHAADMNGILDAAHGMPVIEDTAHAPLSYLHGKMLGTFGIASIYSFASSKYIPAGGGGLLAINDPALADRVAALPTPGRLSGFRSSTVQMAKAMLASERLYGWLGMRVRSQIQPAVLTPYPVDEIGITASSAAAMLRQVSTFPDRVQRQRANSKRLLERLADIDDIVLPWERPGGECNYHLFAVLLRDAAERDAVRRRMLALGVDTSRVHYNCAEFAVQHGYRGGCPVAESLGKRLITLPNHAALTRKQIDRVAEAFRTAVRRHREASRRMEWATAPVGGKGTFGG